jgi:hypothetical protein
MNVNYLNIAIGTGILILLSFSVILAVSSVYIRFILKRGKEDWARITLSSLAISIGWLIALDVSIWLAGSIGVWLFSLVAAVLMFSLMYLTTWKLFGLPLKHRIILSIILTVILNPGWFVLLGAMR